MSKVQIITAVRAPNRINGGWAIFINEYAYKNYYGLYRLMVIISICTTHH